MSARVLRIGMAEMRNIINYDNAIGELITSNASTPPDSTELNRVRRNLFGPVDHEENRRFSERELAAQQAVASDRWGFDFNRGTPRSSGLGTARYSWEKVTPAEAVPEPYALLRMTTLQKIAVDDEMVETEATTASTAAGVAEEKDEAEEVAKQRQPGIKEFMQLQKRKQYPNGAKAEPAAVEQSSSRAKKARSSS